jgi:hypothetical protein
MACVGLYGTRAYAVARRTSEIGIRMALGAERHGIVWMVLREVLAVSATGLAFGFAMVWETTAFLKSFLFGRKPNDPSGTGSLCRHSAGGRDCSRICPCLARVSNRPYGCIEA